MKPPSALEPEFTAEDCKLVEDIEQEVEAYFGAHLESTHVTFSQGEGPAKRRHSNEAVRRIQAAGWRVRVA